MYPNLYYLFEDLFGIEIHFLKIFQTFGFMVALSFLLAAYYFTKELARKQAEGLLQASTKKTLIGAPASVTELITSAILGFIIFYKLVFVVFNFSAFTQDTQGFLLSTHGNLTGGIIGAVLMAYLKYREKEKIKLPAPEWREETVNAADHVGNMTIIAAIAGLSGAKLFDIFESIDSFLADPWGTIFSFSGLTMYGGLIVGSAAVLIYARKNKLILTPVIDACAPGLMLAYGVGRVGCHLSGDGDWGIANTAPNTSFLPDWMWAYNYPHNVIHAGELIPGCTDKYCTQLVPPVYPTPLYEAIICITLFFVLWTLRHRIKTAGVLFCTYLIFNGIERFFIEKIRVNNTYTIAGFAITQAEIIATILFLLGIAGVFYFRKKGKDKFHL
jgi:prolipoprotein diacylglyceryl transferase